MFQHPFALVLTTAQRGLGLLKNQFHSRPNQSEVIFAILLTTITYKDFVLPAWLSHALLQRWQAILWVALVSMLLSCLRQFQGRILLQKAEKNTALASVEGYDLDFDGFRPLLFPCQTSHTRFFPKRHSFTYSYLLVGIPISRKRLAGSGSLSANPTDGSKADAKTWFRVDAQDHLGRGGNERGFGGKIDTYLQSQDEDPLKYPFIYLATAPKFLGYSFNPVSFWYLYDADLTLKAMILEVNNTFDERRIYFLKGDSTHPDVEDERGSPESTFTDAWQKDFHVSPFNSRRGSYSLKASDPMSSLLADSPSISNIITLSSSKSHPKLVASISSTSPSIDPSKLSSFDAFRFALSWSRIGFATFPRIIKEAAKLFFKHKLHVWYRPEVLGTSIGRQPTSYEQVVARLFRDWLQAVVETSSFQRPLEYDAAASGKPSKTLCYSQKSSPALVQAEPISFKPTTPLFYSDLATAPNICTYLTSCLECTDPSKLILHTDDRAELYNLFVSIGTADASSPFNNRNVLSLTSSTRFRWLPVKVLRGRRTSGLDQFAASLSIDEVAEEYRRATVRLLLAKRFSFGWVGVLDILLWCTRSWLLWQSFESMIGLLSPALFPDVQDNIAWLLVKLSATLAFCLAV